MHKIPVPPPTNLSYTITDYQSGYYISGTPDVSYIVGTWNVPVATVAENIDDLIQNTFAWVGINGNPILAQTGTASVINPKTGEARYYTWITMYPSPSEVAQLRVSPGDIVTFSVEYLTSGIHSGDFRFILINNSTNQTVTVYKTPSPATTRKEAIWFAEAPGIPHGKLTRFGYITFTDCSAIVNGVNGGIIARPSTSLLVLNMDSQAGVTGFIHTNKTVLSQVINSNSGFSVTSVR